MEWQLQFAAQLRVALAGFGALGQGPSITPVDQQPGRI